MELFPSFWQRAFAPESVSNWALAIIGVVGVVAALCTLRSLIRQTKATEIAAHAAKVSADGLIASERAWVMVDILQRPDATMLTVEVMEDLGAYIRCVCTNPGKTPAWITEKRICLFVPNLVNPLPKTPDFNIPILDPEPHYLPSGSQSVHDWEIVGKGQPGIGFCGIIYGFVKYKHLFSDREVQTTFGYRINIGNELERLTGYPEYNKNT